MEKYMLCSLIWVYDLERRRLSAFVKNTDNTRVKNLMTGEILDIPKCRGDYGMEYRLDFNQLLHTSGHIQYGFREIYGMAGTRAFSTLAKEAKQVEKDTKRYEKNGWNDSPYDMPEIDIYQYMSDTDIVSATRRAEPFVQQSPEVKRREEQILYSNSQRF